MRSAFGHSGQKCSAASLAILEAEVYDDPVFRRQLRDAAASLKVGPSSDPAAIVTPVILEPDEKLRRALTTLDEGEEWLLEPRVSEDDPLLWSPGIKLGVKPGSWFHQNECFGPVLGLMRAADLDEAIALQNDVAYGLTAGLHSLDEDEIAALEGEGRRRATSTSTAASPGRSCSASRSAAGSAAASVRARRRAARTT